MHILNCLDCTQFGLYVFGREVELDGGALGVVSTYLFTALGNAEAQVACLVCHVCTWSEQPIKDFCPADAVETCILIYAQRGFVRDDHGLSLATLL